MNLDTELRRQLSYLERSSTFYRERLGGLREGVDGVADLPLLPFTTKEELRATQASHPPFGAHLCASPVALVRIHVTSGTTGEPVAIGLTRADHEANSVIGGEAFRIAGVRADDVIAHCLNYALYAGGIADHMALEASGATVVPVGVGQSLRLLDISGRLGITALFGTLSYPAYLAARAREIGIDPAAVGLRHLVTAGEPGAGLAAVRREIEVTWRATVADTFGMSDVWSTMAGECGRGEGLHLTTRDYAVLELVDTDSGEPVPLRDGASGELVWTHLRREASPLLRYRSSDLGTVWTSPCPCGRTGVRIRIDGRLDDMLRVRAANVYPQAVAAVLSRFSGLGRHALVADGDPISPPLRVYVEAERDAELRPIADTLGRELRSPFEVIALERGALPANEHKTRVVYRPACGDRLPESIEAKRRNERT
ncbi:MAG TPA: AMP-binding protein [Thermoleophilaceae bacterium]